MVISLIWWVALRPSTSGPSVHPLIVFARITVGAPVELGGRPVGAVDLAVVETAAAQRPDLVVGPVLDERLQLGLGSEEVLADVGAVLRPEPLVVAIERLVHLVDQVPLDVPGQQLVPAPPPDDLDDVPAGAAEDGLELLDDLAAAPDRAVEPLQVAVDHPGEVVELLPGGEGDRPQRLGLVGLAVADEAPHPRLRGVVSPRLWRYLLNRAW